MATDENKANEIPTDPSRLPTAVSPSPVPDDVDLEHPSLYFNRELSDIDFNVRVLAQAFDDHVPLFERARFLGIAMSNLDEFVQKRIGGLMRQQGAGVLSLSPDGRTPTAQLVLAERALRQIYQLSHGLWCDTLRPKLQQEAGYAIAGMEALAPEQLQWVAEQFRERIYPVLTPLAVDPGRPFPFISNLSLSLAVVLELGGEAEFRFARIKVPSGTRERWFEIEPGLILPIEQVIARNLPALFPGAPIVGIHAFRVTRNAYMHREEEEAEDLLEMISEELRERRFADVVRLEIDRGAPEYLVSFLRERLGIEEESIYRIAPPLALGDLKTLPPPPDPACTYRPWTPQPARDLRDATGTARDIFNVLSERDVLVHHPYESFHSSVLHLVERAAEDPSVRAIKMTLYRTSDRSPIMDALVRAAERGKQVAVLIEIKARFDEANNIEWGRRLENAGVHVAYGMVGLKTHAKTLLIVREEHEGMKTYCHVGTGNYHAGTAELYTDLGLITSDAAIGRDLVKLFHQLMGFAPSTSYERLITAPQDMRRAFLERIGRCARAARKGHEARILAKMNGLDDVVVIRALYEASRAGVRCDLIVRGLCRLRPGIPGVSENIRVRSIIGRFLEHDRVYAFLRGSETEVLVGSADWRRRNLSDRVEVILPVPSLQHRERLTAYLETAWDEELAWELGADGRYQRPDANDAGELGLHERLMRAAVPKSAQGE